MDRHLFIFFCLSEIRANEPHSLDRLEKAPQHLGKRKPLVFQPDCSGVTSAPGNLNARYGKMELAETTKGVILSFYHLLPFIVTFLRGDQMK